MKTVKELIKEARGFSIDNLSSPDKNKKLFKDGISKLYLGLGEIQRVSQVEYKSDNKVIAKELDTLVGTILKLLKPYI